MSLTAIEARLDQLATKLDAFINGDASTLVNTNAGAVKTLAGIQQELFRTRGLVECKEYEKLIDLPSNAVLNTVARVSNDGSNNGLYIRRIGTWGLYGWQDIQYFIPTNINQEESKVYFTSNDLTSGTILAIREVAHSTVKNTAIVMEVDLVAWQNVSDATPSAEVKQFTVLVTSRDASEVQYQITPKNTTQVADPIAMSLAVTHNSTSGKNVITLRLSSANAVPDVFGVATIKTRLFDSQQ